MKKRRSNTRRIVDPILPKSMRRPVASTLAPDIYVDGKLWKGGRSIMDFMPGGKYARKSNASAK